MRSKEWRLQEHYWSNLKFCVLMKLQVLLITKQRKKYKMPLKIYAIMDMIIIRTVISILKLNLLILVSILSNLKINYSTDLLSLLLLTDFLLLETVIKLSFWKKATLLNSVLMTNWLSKKMANINFSGNTKLKAQNDFFNFKYIFFEYFKVYKICLI